MKKIRFLDVSFRDGFQSCLGARVKMEDFLPALQAACEAGIDSFEVAGGARFQSPFFYLQENAFDMMDACRETVGPDVNLQSLARGANVVGLKSQCRDIIDLHAKMFAKHGISTIRNFDALNDVRNLDYSGRCIKNHGAKHQVVVALMGLPPGLNETYAHTAEFYCDILKQILEAGIPYDSVCFKDASGTATPSTVHATIKKAREILGDDTDIEFHSHTTGGSAGNCLMAAIEAGADIIDLAMSPVSGGTSHMDILSMWHILRGTDYVLANNKGEEIDYEKILQAEEKLSECLDHYFFGPESRETNPLIALSPMPGGALTANTVMMRDNNCMHLYNDVIKSMREVVARGGFGTSVTPVSQFYFQQAFQNVMDTQSGNGPWTKITDGYGKMVLGYFGKTPAKPDAEIVKLAAQQLGKEPTTEDVHDINDRDPELGIEAARDMLTKNGLETSEENIFIAATCEQKGIDFLKGESPLMQPLKETEIKKQVEKTLKENKKLTEEVVEDLGLASSGASGEPESYTVTVDGKAYHVNVAPGTGEIQNVQAASAASTGGNADGVVITAPMPGTVVRTEVEEGDAISEGDTIVVVESMKMENPIKASVSGVIGELMIKKGDSLSDGDSVARID